MHSIEKLARTFTRWTQPYFIIYFCFCRLILWISFRFFIACACADFGFFFVSFCCQIPSFLVLDLFSDPFDHIICIDRNFIYRPFRWNAWVSIGIRKMNWNKKSNCSATKGRSLFAFYEFWHVLWMGENSSKINVSNGIALIYWISSLSFKMNCTAFKVSQNYWRYSAQCSKANQPLWRRQQRRSLNHQTPHRMMIANDGFEESEKAIN